MIKRILAALLSLLLVLPCFASCDMQMPEFTFSLPAWEGETVGQNNPQNDDIDNSQENEDIYTDPPIYTDATDATEAPSKNPYRKLPNVDFGNDVRLSENTFKDGIRINGVDISSFTVVYGPDGRGAISAKSFAIEFAQWIKDTVGVELSVVDETAPIKEHEIIFGKTSTREESLEASNYKTDTRFDFTALLMNGKLAVSAISKEGYHAAFGSIKNALKACGGDIKRSFRNNTLTHDYIKELAVGCIDTEYSMSGVSFYGSTDKQNEYWATANPEEADNSKYLSGCRIDFVTDSSFVYFAVTRGICVLLVNGQMKRSAVASCYYKLDDEGNDLNRVTIILPESNSYEWALKELQVDCGAYFVPYETEINMLFLGDDITFGYNNQDNASNTYTFYTANYFKANTLIQAPRGSTPDPDYLDPELNYEPDVIILAYGTNDWEKFKAEYTVDDFKEKLNAYIDRLLEIYPDVPVIAISPINRYNMGGNWKTTFYDARAAYQEVFTERGFFVVKGEEMIPLMHEYYYDNIHPNPAGFIEFGKNLCAAIEDRINEIKEAKNNG